MSSKILVVEDDQVISDGIMQALKSEGYIAKLAADGEEGLYEADTWSPDLMILDIMMPYLNGFEVITDLRRKGNQTPILVLSAKTATHDKIKGLDLGANDYLAKPFDLQELLARIRNLLRMNSKESETFGGYTYNWVENNLYRGRELIVLNSKERSALEFFLRRKNRIVTRYQLLDAVWGDDYEGTDRTVDNLIVQLRKKTDAKHFLTERGEGYRFISDV